MDIINTLEKSSILWPILFYWLYCVFVALFQGRAPLFFTKKPRNYFIAGRSLDKWVFIFAATATSFSGWTFISHPGIIYEFGFSAAFISLYAITIPLAGVFFLKRQWMLGKRCGFVTPGEMFYAYFKSDIMRYLVLTVAVLFSLFYIAVQLRATGHLFNILTGGSKLSVEHGVILLSIVLILYVTIGGLRTVAYMDTMQAILLACGIIALGYIVLEYIQLADGMENFANFQQYFYETPKHFTIPSMFSGETKTAIADTGNNYWTATLIFTFLFALMGIQSSPAFSMWAFSVKDANAFGYQQVWASSLIIGFILIVFTAIIGIGGHFLGADYVLRENSEIIANRNLLGVFIDDKDLLHNGSKDLVPLLIRMTLKISPWLLGILAISALAAIQSTAASYMSTVGSMLSRDLLKNGVCSDEKNIKKIIFGFIIPIIILLLMVFKDKEWSNQLSISLFLLAIIPISYYNKNISDNWQKYMAAIFTFVITLGAIGIAIESKETLAFLGALAVAYGVQMMPALIAICWWPFLTSKGIVTGLIFGIFVVTLTESSDFFGQWPLTIHSAFWGFSANLLVAITISYLQGKSKFTRILGEDKDRNHRDNFHKFLNDPFLENVKKPSVKYNISKLRKILVIVIGWALLTILPFAIPFTGISPYEFYGQLLGQPTDASTWWPNFPIIGAVPPIWAWQIICWGIGVWMMYWLAFSNRLSTFSKEDRDKKIQPLALNLVDISEYNDKYCENIYPDLDGK